MPKWLFAKIIGTGTYDPDSFDNDLAILEVTKDFHLNNIVQRICLADHQYPAGESCFVSGWGHDESMQTDVHNIIDQPDYIIM